MVKRVLAKIKKDGLEATCRAINSGAKEFHDRDLYPFIDDFSGNNHANGGTPSVVGKNILDIKDQDGKFVISGILHRLGAGEAGACVPGSKADGSAGSVA